MDSFCIFSPNGKLMIEQIFNNKIKNNLEYDLKEIITSKKHNKDYYLILNNENETQFLKKNENNFVYLIKKDDLLFISLKKNENNPILIIEMTQELIKNLKKYFNTDKLNENILINNYSIVNFLINEILVQGRPSLFIDEILKILVKNEFSFLNETLKFSPIPNNIYNMITQKKNNLINNLNNENNINYSYSNGNSVNSNDSMHIYWRVNNNNVSSNEIYIDVIENVNCIVNKFNKIIHYCVEGNVVINATVKGSPLIKLYINNIDLNKCNFHFTVNYSKLINRKKLKKDENVIYFVPLSHEFVLLQYFYFHVLKENVEKKFPHFNPSEQLTNVLNLKNIKSAYINNDICDKTNKKNSLKEDEYRKNDDKDKKELHSDNEKGYEGKTFEIKNSKKEYYEKNDNEYIYNNKEQEKYDYINLSNSIGEKLLCVYDNVSENNDISLNNDNNILFDEENEECKLPLNVKGDVIFTSAENMYKIKINVILNNINTKSNSNQLLNSYENILLKIPIHNFISSINFHCSLGKLNYNEKASCLFWYIQSITDKNIPISTNISLYLKSNKNNYNLSHIIYPSFNFVVYVSLKINGISITRKRIEKIDIQNSKNLDIRKGCRYTTYFNNIEFRI
ncbi:adaptor complexes medium subunit family [Plasmodium gallinaceum]|uniref:Adaptor complexes medium subunit family n=1 Tax=Plasmodium gallinaceum TaxID=5849 RepID=A0A1J1GQN7_PLAGA|nr:adaptor complexes medium subunit family [Plasmodium gallinaceum]CRG94602.1 adaptor complexes medium subunit family [Plasmodium gallinaceum]